MEQIVLAAGCFWCTQAIFERIKGVQKILCVYANGHTENPTYEEVCAEKSGYAEAAQIWFNENEISLEEILDIFWQTHDPTSLNRQGHDVGGRYRSAIYFTQNAQLPRIEKSCANAQKKFLEKIVTQIEGLKKIYVAEEYHQNYYNANKERNPYCAAVISPKVAKLKKITPFFKPYN